MARAQETFGKKEREKKRLKKREDKKKRKEARKANAGGGSLEEMLVYVDENGHFTDIAARSDQKGQGRCRKHSSRYSEESAPRRRGPHSQR